MIVEKSGDLDELRESAQHEIDSLIQLRTLLLEQHTHSFKWLNASLLAMNGGALVAILNSEKLQPNIFPATFCFLSGIVLSLLIGVAAQKISIQSLKPYQRMIGYWISVKSDGKRISAFEDQLGDELVEANKYGWIVPAVGWLSGVSFLLGCVLLFSSIQPQEREGFKDNEQGSCISRDDSIRRNGG